MKKDDKKSKLHEYFLSTAKDEEDEQVPEEVKRMYLLWSPTDIQRSKDRWQNLNRHDLYKILADQHEKLIKKGEERPLTDEEKKGIFEKINALNPFIDQANGDETMKKDLVQIASDHGLNPKDLVVRAAQYLSGKIDPNSLKRYEKKLHEEMIKTRKSGFKEAKRRGMQEWKEQFRPNRIIMRRTLRALGIVAALGIAFAFYTSFKSERAKRNFYDKVVEEVRGGGSGADARQSQVDDIYTPKEHLDNIVKGITGSQDSTEVKTEQRQEQQRPPVEKPKPRPPATISSIVDSVYKQIKDDNLKAQTFKVNPVNVSYTNLTNSGSVSRLKRALEMEIGNQSYVTTISKARLAQKIDSLKNIVSDYPQSQQAYEAQLEVAKLSFEHMEILNVDGFKEYQQLITLFGNTKEISTNFMKVLIDRKWAADWWKIQQSDRQESAVAQKSRIANKIVQWLENQAIKTNPVGYEANYILGQILAGEKELQSVYQKDANDLIYLHTEFLSSVSGLDKSNNAMQARYSASARGGWDRAARAKFSYAVGSGRNNGSKLKNLADALKYDQKARWVPRAIYLIAETEVQMKNMDLAEDCMNFLQKNFPGNESSGVGSLVRQISDYRAKQVEVAKAKSEADYKKLKEKSRK